ncbi:tRNA-dihydrouridine synthase [Histoplasma capsulatum var. duboisii H88]|uniref:tRNA-dihydrouridine synthase n=2 Tax=Ajellomyces capsulatus (strain H88) TaxID=544711 RepID=A0A8A1LVB4_AJEC8|nr:tRNA-dihydrouridine synthase [Histoplasma capsulatum var. duboisii H88]
MLKRFLLLVMGSIAKTPLPLSPSPPTIASSLTPRVPIPKNGVDYRGKIVLAPMVRSGELPSRLLALKYGADLVWGPETIDRALIGCTRRINPRNSMVEFTRLPSNGGRENSQAAKESIIYRLDPRRESGKLVFQIGTASPDLAVQAAKIIAADVAGIDVNAGCPKPFSTTGGMGAALLQTPDRLVSILTALVQQVGTPYQIGISVKIRLLADPERTRDLVTRLCATGITGLTVHCRTTPMRPRERAIRDQLPMIASICRAAGVAILVNGDVESRDHGLALMAEYGVDGAMIATCAEANSSCFRSAADGSLLPWRAIVRDYMDLCLQCENKWGNTKYLLNMLIPGKERAFNAAKQSKSYQDCCRVLGFEDLIARAREVDEIIGRTPAADAASVQDDYDSVSDKKRQNTDKKYKKIKSPAVQRAMLTNETAKAAGISAGDCNAYPVPGGRMGRDKAVKKTVGTSTVGDGNVNLGPDATAVLMDMNMAAAHPHPAMENAPVASPLHG